jgi:hypothetical protein
MATRQRANSVDALTVCAAGTAAVLDMFSVLKKSTLPKRSISAFGKTHRARSKN